MCLLHKVAYYFFLFSLICLAACDHEDEDVVNPRAELVGTWDLAEVRTEFPADTDLAAFYRQYFERIGVPASDIDELVTEAVTLAEEPMNDLVGELTWTLHADGSFTERDGAAGTWSLNDDSILTINDGSDETQMTVASVTNTSLVVHQDVEAFYDEAFLDGLGFSFPEGTFVRYRFTK